MKRREVADDEIRRVMADRDCQLVLQKALARYGRRLQPDDLELCGLHAVWRCLGYHQDGMGQKFTTNLYRFAKFACLSETKRQRSAGKNQRPLSPHDEPRRENANAKEADRDDVRHMQECMRFLSDEQREILREHHVEGMTYEEIAARRGMSRAAVGHRLDLAARRLRELCEEAVYLEST